MYRILSLIFVLRMMQEFPSKPRQVCLFNTLRDYASQKTTVSPLILAVGRTLHFTLARVCLLACCHLVLSTQLLIICYSSPLQHGNICSGFMLVLVSAWNFQHHHICSTLGVASQLEQCLLPPLITSPVYFPLSRFQCRAVASTAVQVRCVSHVHGQWASNRKRWPSHDYRYKWNCRERFSAAFTSYMLQATYSVAVNALLQFQRPCRNRNGNRKGEKQEAGGNFVIFADC